MRDIVMVAVMIAAIVLLAAYVALCDRVVMSGEDAAVSPSSPEARRRNVERDHEVAA